MQNRIDVFTRDLYKQIICDSLNYCIDKKGLEVFSYVIMTNHLHLISRAKNSNLSDVIRDFKKFTSGTILKYIHNNPVEAGLVQYPEQYLYSSARDYAGIKGPVNVSVINLHNLFY